MPASRKPSRRVIVVVLKLPEDDVPLLLTRAGSIVEMMTGNSWFPSPSPTLAAVQAAIDELHAAQTATLSRTKGTVATRDEKVRPLRVLLRQLAGYVEDIATANPEQAESIVASAGMYLKEKGGRTAQVLRAERGERAGDVRVLVPTAGDRAIHEVEYSLDGEITWLRAAIDTRATALIPNLQPGSTVHIRHRVILKGVAGPWSASIPYIVH